jgi:hypothetical protein
MSKVSLGHLPDRYYQQLGVSDLIDFTLVQVRCPGPGSAPGMHRPGLARLGVLWFFSAFFYPTPCLRSKGVLSRGMG